MSPGLHMHIFFNCDVARFVSIEYQLSSESADPESEGKTLTWFYLAVS